ncbi:MAG: NTP transferase domain-containing protein [Muribaculaceae bacterium]|nr:NTP transferase domain-containing protein [Muribaculaceae bacterium]
MHYAIIAAGNGSRLRHEGVEAPKPLVELDGRPMVRRLIEVLASYKPESLSIVVNEHMPEVAAYIESIRDTFEFPVYLTVKTTASGVHSLFEVTRRFAGGKMVITTVDTIFLQSDFARYAEAFDDDDDADAFFGVTPFIDDEKPLYVDVDPATQLITGFRGEPSAHDRYVSGGIYGLTAPAVSLLDDFVELPAPRLREYQSALVTSGLKVRAFPFPKIVDVDHAADISTARQFIMND